MTAVPNFAIALQSCISFLKIFWLQEEIKFGKDPFGEMLVRLINSLGHIFSQKREATLFPPPAMKFSFLDRCIIECVRVQELLSVHNYAS